jgi:hypothetical protein
MKLIHPYDDLTNGQWLRGNLHCHSTRSDGTRDSQLVIDDYAARGYQFLMLSDHDIHSSEDDLARLDARGMVLLPGNEISAAGAHTLHVGADRHVPASRQRQTCLDAISAGTGFAVLCHSNGGSRHNHCTIEQMREWVGYLGIEIFNGSPREGSPYAVNKWDMMLTEGRRVWGFANDDCHRGDDDVELGWNVVYVQEPTAQAVLESLRAGRFYASTGVTINHIHADGDRVHIDTKDAQRIIGLMNGGKRFAIVEGSSIDVRIPSAARFVRFECWGAGERVAWTQPFFVEQAVRPASSTTAPVGEFVTAWRVSPLDEKGSLDTAKPVTRDAEAVDWPELRAHSIGPNTGFTDVRAAINKRAGLVRMTTLIDSPVAQRVALYLGYDGPVRAWLGEQQLFEGPGSNPARADRTAVYAHLRPGPNRLTVALDSANGLAWGVYCRVVRESATTA